MNISKTEWNFYMTIELHLSVCPNIGKPICAYTGKPISLNIDDYIIPEKFRKWCKYKGPQFQHYILELDNEHHTTIDAKRFFDNFPEWDDIKDNFNDNWTENDHNEFLNFVEYLSKYPGYILSWNY
jgi:hypothetical protein